MKLCSIDIGLIYSVSLYRLSVLPRTRRIQEIGNVRARRDLVDLIYADKVSREQSRSLTPIDGSLADQLRAVGAVKENITGLPVNIVQSPSCRMCRRDWTSRSDHSEYCPCGRQVIRLERWTSLQFRIPVPLNRSQDATMPSHAVVREGQAASLNGRVSTA